MFSTHRALVFSFGGQYGSIVFQFVTTVVISRLLLPEEVGIYSIGAALLLISQVLRDFGTGQYIVQEQELTEDRIRAAFTATLAIAWSLAAIIIFSAPWVGTFYGQQGVTQVLTLLSVNFILLPFGTITSAYLRRQMDFKPILVSQLSSAAAGGIVTVSCAFAGFSYMSMAWGGIASTLAAIGVMAYYRPKDLPFLPGTREIRRVLSFGSKMSAVEMMMQLSAAIPELVIGKTLGMHSVGVYSRATGNIRLFGQLFMQGVSPVMNSLFAQKKRDNEDLRAPYVKGVSYITVIAWPFYGGMALLAKELTLVLFGPNWLEIVPLVQIACISAGLYHLTSLAERVFASTGNVNRLLRFSIAIFPIRIILVTSAAFISLNAVLLVGIIVSLIRNGLLFRALKEITGITRSDYLRILNQSFTAFFATIIGAFAGKTLAMEYAFSHEFFVLISGFLCGTLCWVIAIYWMKHALAQEVMQILKLLRNSLLKHKN